MCTHSRRLTAILAACWLGLLPGAWADEEKPAKGADEAAPAKSSQPALTVGKQAPALKVEKFLKGEPVTEFKPGRAYVVEFWSTWCGPCKAAMPHLTELQKRYQEKVTFISVNIWEEKEYTAATLKKVEQFVKQNDAKMGYTVAFDGAARGADNAYMQAADLPGIPAAMIVTGDGRIGYIGHPLDEGFEETLKQLADGSFKLADAIKAHEKRRAEEAATQRNFEQLGKLSREAGELIKADKIDEAQAKYAEMVKLVPSAELGIENEKFMVLLNAGKYEPAYDVAAKLIDGLAKDDAELLNAIAWAVVDPDAKLAQRNTDVAQRAAQRAVKLTEEKNPALLDTLARCHWVKGEKDKALELQKKAYDLCKNGDNKELKEAVLKALNEYKQRTK